MSTFKRILQTKSEISQKNFISEAKKDLPKGNPGGMTPGDIEGFKEAKPGERPKNLSTDYDTTNRRTKERIYRTGRKIRTRGSATPNPDIKTVEQTPVNKYIRTMQDQGRPVSQELGDAAGVRDAARRGEIKPVQAGESKPTASQSRVSRVRLKGDLAASGVDTSPSPSKRGLRNVPLRDTTKGGPVKTFKPAQPAPAPKPETVKKPVPTLSKRGALSKKVDPVLKGLRKQGALERRMSAAVDSRSASSKELADKASKIIKDLRTKPPVAKPTAPPKSTVTVKQSDSSIQQRNYRASQKLQTARPTQSNVAKTVQKIPNVKDFAFATDRMQKVDKAAADKKLASTANKELQKNLNRTTNLSKVRSKSMKTGLPPAAANKTAAVNLSTVTTGKDTFKPSKPDLGPRSVRSRVGASTLRGNASAMFTKQLEVKSKPKFSRSQVKARANRMARSKMGRAVGAPVAIGLGAWDAWSELDNKSKDYVSRGGSGKTTTKDKARAITRGVASALGYGAGAALAAPIAAAPVPGARPAAFVAGAGLGLKGSELATNAIMGKDDKRFNRTYDTIAGFSASQKKELAKRNRQTQSGTKLKDVTNITGNKGIIRGKDGKETVGYAAKYTNPKGEVKTVFKRAADPSTLRYTSSNPLERLGRGFASTNLPGAGFVKDRYKENDAEVRRKKVAALKALSMKESVLSEGMGKNIKKMIDRILKRPPKVKTPPTSGGARVTGSGGQTVGNTRVTSGTGGSGNTRVTGNTNTGASSATSNTLKKIKDILKKPTVRNTGIGAAVLGGTMLVGDQLTKDSPMSQGDSADSKSEKGPVFDTPDGPKQFPPLKPLPSLPKDEKKDDEKSTKPTQYVRSGHWRAINDPPQFHRRPALDAYRNIRATKKNY